MCELRHPIVRSRHLRARGWDRARRDAAVRGGDLRRVRPGTFVAVDACATARMVAEHGGAVACVTAARHLGIWVIDDEDDRPHVWMRQGQRSHHPQGCTCVTHWDESHAERLSEPSVPRILRQILGCHGEETFFVALESARRLGLLDDEGLAWLHAHAGPRGREALELARDDADSGLESLVRWRLRHRGLDVRTQLDVVGVGWVDLLIGDRLLIEADGRKNHDGPSKRHKDLVRDANAALWGYMTLRFDYAMILHDWDLVEAAILGALAGPTAAR